MNAKGAPIYVARRVTRPGIVVAVDGRSVGMPEMFRGFDDATGHRLLAELLEVISRFAREDDEKPSEAGTNGSMPSALGRAAGRAGGVEVVPGQ
jgi:hypothetical protein